MTMSADGSPTNPPQKRAKIEKPKKSDYRQRAHCNPLSDFLSPYPISPDHCDWSLAYPEICEAMRRSAIASSSSSRSGYPSSEAYKAAFKAVNLERHEEETRAASTNIDVSKISKEDAGDSPNSDDEDEKPKNKKGKHSANEKYLTKTQNPEQSLVKLFLNTHDYPVAYSQEKLVKPNTPVFYHAGEAPKEEGKSQTAEEITGAEILSNKNLSGCNVDFLDIGCGFGGLTVALAEAFPDKISMGLEIREQVTNYVGLRILAGRQAYRSALAANNETLPHHFCNASVLRTNAMKTLPNYFRKGQLEKLFFCFPDPHFKKKNFRRRIVNSSLLSIYSHFLKPGGNIYCITDVLDLHEWMRDCLLKHPGFEEVYGTEKDGVRKENDVGSEENADENKLDPKLQKIFDEDKCVQLIHTETEEGKKVTHIGRFGKKMHFCVFEKKAE